MIQIQQQTSLAPTFLQSATFEHCFAIKSLKRFYILHVKCNFMLSFSPVENFYLQNKGSTICR